MGFARKTIYGYKEMWDKITTKISAATGEIKTWCNNTFSLTTHNHDTKYDSKGSALTVQTNLNTHDGNTTKHITASERTTWNSKASGSHTHTTSQISGLDTALANKAASNHTHTASSLGTVGFPNYSNKQSLGQRTSYKCTSDCWIGLYNYSDHTVIDVYVNGVFLYKEGGEEWQTVATLIPLRTNDTISTSVAIQYDLYPMR